PTRSRRGNEADCAPSNQRGIRLLTSAATILRACFKIPFPCRRRGDEALISSAKRPFTSREVSLLVVSCNFKMRSKTEGVVCFCSPLRAAGAGSRTRPGCPGVDASDRGPLIGLDAGKGGPIQARLDPGAEAIHSAGPLEE